MSERNDLTRWNHAGLTRFRYVDGKAAEYLEILRQQLVEQFADPDTGLCEWLKPAKKIPANEEKAETEILIQRQERLSRKQERILEMYHQDRRDWAWEITRTFARACHILTEHTNAYANEGYLGTATQWDNVRRLVEMLDYHPAPPASASTRLVLIAKQNKKGIVSKGFQVKNNPTPPEAKVIFETLEDIVLDFALNELRPKGWDQSDDPAASLPDGSTTSPGQQRLFSIVAEGPAINLQGVGDIWSDQLNTLTDPENFKIKDFLELDPKYPGIILDPADPNFKLDPDNPGAEIGEIRLNEFKARASAICNFELEEGWSDITNWLLPRIASETPESLTEQTGKSLTEVKTLQLKIELIGSYLDHEVYAQTKLKELIAPGNGGQDKDSDNPQSVRTEWKAKQKPKIVAGQVAMIMRESEDEDEAEGATISKVDESTKDIHQLLDQVDYSWTKWPKSEIALHVSPRWKRECRLNGSNVIRTKEPHGLSAESYIGWKRDSIWQYAKIEEADKFNLRIKYKGLLPIEGTELFQLNAIEGSKISPCYEVVVLLGDETDGGDIRNAVNDVPLEIEERPNTDSIFTINEPVLPQPKPEGGGGFLPPGSLPKIGSFLFPSPMLPMDLVKAAVELLLNLGVMQIPSSGEYVFKGLSLGGINDAVDNLYDVLEGLSIPKFDEDGLPTDQPPTKLVQWTKDNEDDRKDGLRNLLIKPDGSTTVLFQEIKKEIVRKGPLLAIPKDPPVLSAVVTSDPLYMFDGKPGELENSDWVVGRFTDGLRGLKIRAITDYSNDDSEKFLVSFSNLLGNEGELQKVYADFRGSLIAEGASVNTTDIESIELELEDVPDSLKSGSEVLLTAEGKKPVVAKIEDIDVEGNTIKTNPSAEGFTKGELKILANVVLAGHGESKPAKILGSGNAVKSNQEFTLEVEKVSFTPDATKSSGVAAAIEVEVAGRVWEQVSTLKDSAPGDHHYAIRMTEEGYVKFLFGDGEYGRRLPSGKNNIRVRYRVGSGLSGNVPAGGLEKPVSPHPLIKAVLQPLPAAGGGDMEDMASLRENAPSTLLALERAVSLADFSHLAAAQSSVWQAKAYSQILHGGRTESVKVVIVPADGVQSDEILEANRSFLQKHAMPGVQVTVENFDPVLFSLNVTVRVKTDEFIAEEVEKAVASALVDHFVLRNRKLGEPLYLSEVYKVVEGIQGVENSICVLNNDNTLQLIRAKNERTVVYLDTDAGSTLTVTAEEYLP